MEIVLLILVLVLVILLFRSHQKDSETLSEIRQQLDELKRGQHTPPIEPVPEFKKPPVEILPPASPVAQEVFFPANPIAKTAPPKPLPVMEDSMLSMSNRKEQPLVQEPGPSWFSKWLHENPDIEKFIGENLINKVGIAVLVLGIAFFVKYAIDQEWINRVGRVCIGLICGGLLLAFAHRLRKNYHSFSSVLVGGGLTVFYFTIAFAFHQYHLFSQPVAFVIMVVVTVFAVLLSILYSRVELGILATVGGFITPFLVSNGDGNYIALFTYLAILNAGLIVLAYNKGWRVLNFLAFVFTQILFLAWIFNRAGLPGFSYCGTFLFGALFYLLFIGMNVIHHVSRRSRLMAFDFIILLSVNLFFYGSGVYLLQGWGYSGWLGLFTASLGIINLALAYLFFRQTRIDQNFVYLLIGITLSFISLAAPVQLNGHYITLFWATEMVVLIWLYQKSGIRLIRIASLLICFLMIISLIMDWSTVYLFRNNRQPVIFNKGFVTGFCCALAAFTAYRLWRKEITGFYLPGISNRLIQYFYFVIAVGLFYIAGSLEINQQFVTHFPGTGLQYVYAELYNVSFVIGLLAFLKKRNIPAGKIMLQGLPLLIFTFYLLNIRHVYHSELQLLTSGQYKIYFWGNWLGIILIMLLCVNCNSRVRKNNSLSGNALTAFSVIIALALIIIFSVELRNLSVWMNFSGADSIRNTENIYGRAGLSIIWGLSSFVIIWLGMKFRFKSLRVLALIIFGITLIKLFIYDIRNIPPGGKIAAFILLGVLLLVISFMYQRLKKIIIDDERHPV